MSFSRALSKTQRPPRLGNRRGSNSLSRRTHFGGRGFNSLHLHQIPLEQGYLMGVFWIRRRVSVARRSGVRATVLCVSKT